MTTSGQTETFDQAKSRQQSGRSANGIGYEVSDDTKGSTMRSTTRSLVQNKSYIKQQVAGRQQETSSEKNDERKGWSVD